MSTPLRFSSTHWSRRIATIATGFLGTIAFAVDVTVNPDTGRAPISPYVYGTNADLPGVHVPLRRQGGNRMTGYNWETNASNAGQDYRHQSDNYLLWVNGLSDAQGATPAIVVTNFHDQSLIPGQAYSLVTLPMAGYVAADMKGPVAAAEAAPSVRWNRVVNTKPTALSLTPDLTDGTVYTDELLNFLTRKFGPASSSSGIRAYNLDNEPDLWSAGKTVSGVVQTTDNGTHPLLHPAHPLCTELIERSVDLAKTVKRVDPAAETYGFVSYGMSGYESFQGAPDWEMERKKGAYNWFLDYYLDQMKKASDTAGRRLLDVVDLHNYTEARPVGADENGPKVVDITDYTNTAANQARLQAPRTFWDPTYRENSWIGHWRTQFLPFLPKIKASIDTFYPGTKLAFTEYNFGGESHITGGIAEADILGIFGRDGVYAAALWPFHSDLSYAAAAFNLYLNYDGAGSRFGDTSVTTTGSDVAAASVYAAIEGDSSERLHVIVLNKSYDTPTTFNISLGGATTYRHARVFAFDASSATITERDPVANISGNRLTYTLPALTAAHFVIEAAPVSAAPGVQAVAKGGTAAFKASAYAVSAYRWQRNGAAVAGTAATLAIPNVSTADTGLYTVADANSSGTPTSTPVIVGLASTTKVADFGKIVGENIPHPNGNHYDQVLLTNSAASITASYSADPALNRITRMSFVDIDDDIVQVEYSGPGTVSVLLDGASGPTGPAKYVQPNVEYMKGHAAIVVTGADQRSNLTVFSVGRKNAVNQTLFRNDVNYGGMADIAFIAIASANGKFGGVRCANVSFWADRGFTGIYAPGVSFDALFIGELSAHGIAKPVIVTGSVADARVTGGNLEQSNHADVQVDGLTSLSFTAGADSHGNAFPAQVNKAVLRHNGADVTAQLVKYP